MSRQRKQQHWNYHALFFFSFFFFASYVRHVTSVTYFCAYDQNPRSRSDINRRIIVSAFRYLSVGSFFYFKAQSPIHFWLRQGQSNISVSGGKFLFISFSHRNQGVGRAADPSLFRTISRISYRSEMAAARLLLATQALYISHLSDECSWVGKEGAGFVGEKIGQIDRDR